MWLWWENSWNATATQWMGWVGLLKSLPGHSWLINCQCIDLYTRTIECTLSSSVQWHLLQDLPSLPASVLLECSSVHIWDTIKSRTNEWTWIDQIANCSGAIPLFLPSCAFDCRPSWGAYRMCACKSAWAVVVAVLVWWRLWGRGRSGNDWQLIKMFMDMYL